MCDVVPSLRSYIWGERLLWANGLTFDVRVIGTSSSGEVAVALGAVREMGQGQYNVTFTPTMGSGSQAIMVLYNTEPVPGSPLSVPLRSGTVVARTTRAVGTGVVAGVRGEVATFVVQGVDAYGNAQRSGGQSELLNFTLSVPREPDAVYAAPTSTSHHITAHHRTSQYTSRTLLFEAKKPKTNICALILCMLCVVLCSALDRIEDVGDGTYRVQYGVPTAAADTYEVSVFWGGAPISGSPFVVTAYTAIEISRSAVQGIAVLTVVCAVVVVVYMGLIVRHRDTPVMRPSSPLFMLLICLGGTRYLFTRSCSLPLGLAWLTVMRCNVDVLRCAKVCCCSRQ